MIKDISNKRNKIRLIKQNLTDYNIGAAYMQITKVIALLNLICRAIIRKGIKFMRKLSYEIDRFKYF